VRIEATTRYADFDRDDVDLAIRYGAGRWSGLECTELLRITGLPVATRASSGGAAVATNRMILRRRASSTTLRSLAPGAPGSAPREFPNATKAATCGSTVRRRRSRRRSRILGVALAVDPLIYLWPGFGERLIAAFPGLSGPRARYWLVRRPESDVDPKIRAFVSWVRAASRSSTAPPPCFDDRGRPSQREGQPALTLTSGGPNGEKISALARICICLPQGAASIIESGPPRASIFAGRGNRRIRLDLAFSKEEMAFRRKCGRSSAIMCRPRRGRSWSRAASLPRTRWWPGGVSSTRRVGASRHWPVEYGRHRVDSGPALHLQRRAADVSGASAARLRRQHGRSGDLHLRQREPRRSIICRASPMSTTGGARAFRSRAPAPTSPR